MHIGKIMLVYFINW